MSAGLPPAPVHGRARQTLSRLIAATARWSLTLAISLLTVVGLTYSMLLEGSVLTELVFAWPGIGSYLTGALLNAAMNAVLGSTLVIGVSFITLNLAIDALYRVLDPRTR